MKPPKRGTQHADVLSRYRVWPYLVLGPMAGKDPFLSELAVLFFLNRFADSRAYGFISGVDDDVGRKDEGDGDERGR